MVPFLWLLLLSLGLGGAIAQTPPPPPPDSASITFRGIEDGPAIAGAIPVPTGADELR